MPTFGVLGVGGIVAFVIGALIADRQRRARLRRAAGRWSRGRACRSRAADRRRRRRHGARGARRPVVSGRRSLVGERGRSAASDARAKPGRGAAASAGACQQPRRWRPASACGCSARDGLTLEVGPEPQTQHNEDMFSHANAAFTLHRASIVVVLILFCMSIRILREYERARGVQLGRFWRVKGPGLVLLIPVIQQMVRVDLRTIVHRRAAAGRDLARQRLGEGQRGGLLPRRRSRTRPSSRWRTSSMPPASSRRPRCARCSASTSSTRCWPSASKLNLDIQRILDAQTDAWGIKVTNVEIKHVDIDESHDPRHRPPGRSRARRAAPSHPRRGRAAGGREAAAGRRRCWRSSRRRCSCATCRRCSDIAGDKNSTIVFPVPIDMLNALLGLKRSES